jgi:hypothetical protein
MLSPCLLRELSLPGVVTSRRAAALRGVRLGTQTNEQGQCC